VEGSGSGDVKAAGGSGTVATEQPWLVDVPAAATPEMTKRPLWSVPRRADGAVDELAERQRAQLLVDAVESRTTGEGYRLRYRDLRFSFHDTQPQAGEAARFLRSIADQRYKSPLSHDHFEEDLLLHPDRMRVALLLDTLRNGANLGFDGDRGKVAVPRNHGSADENAAWLSSDFEKDVESGRVIGWFDQPPFDNFRCSPLAVVPKLDAGKTVGWRRILDCSAPEGNSLNDFIDKLECRVIAFEAAVAMIETAGPGARLAKFDVDSAFRTVRVRDDDLQLLGFSHLGKFAFDSVCSFGARTSPPIWERVATALNWVFVRVDGIERVVHWVDDFLFCWRVYEDADEEFAAALARCERLGIPVKPPKTVWPCTKLTFAGFLFDTVRGTISVTAERRAYILTLIEAAERKVRMAPNELSSLLGRLFFVSRVLPAGRGFVNRLLSALRGKEHRRQVRLTTEMNLDLRWWLRVLPSWSGISLISQPQWCSSADLEIESDASEWGMGGCFGSRWFAEPWSQQQLADAHVRDRISMPLLELTALVHAARLWAAHWRGKRIRFACDCLPVVYALNKGTTRAPKMAAQLRVLCSLSVEFGFEFGATHVAGLTNVRADCLSRGQMPPGLAAELRSRLTSSTPLGAIRA
jgi:hypothetical protein